MPERRQLHRVSEAPEGACPTCQQLAGTVKLAPHPGCTCPGGCQCTERLDRRRLCPIDRRPVIGYASKVFCEPGCRFAWFDRMRPRRRPAPAARAGRRERPPAPPRHRADIPAELVERIGLLQSETSCSALSRNVVVAELLVAALESGVGRERLLELQGGRRGPT